MLKDGNYALLWLVMLFNYSCRTTQIPLQKLPSNKHNFHFLLQMIIYFSS